MSLWKKLFGVKELRKDKIAEKSTQLFPAVDSQIPSNPPIALTSPTAPHQAQPAPEELCASFHKATRDGDLQKIQVLLQENPKLAFSKDKGLVTPLHWAADWGYKDIADLLLAYGADVNARNNIRSVPLHKAAAGGHDEVAKLLLAKKADVNAKNLFGETPLHGAVDKGHKAVTELLLANNADPNVRIQGKPPLLEAAAETGCGWAVEKGGMTNMMAVRYLEVAELLRRYGGGYRKISELKCDGAAPFPLLLYVVSRPGQGAIDALFGPAFGPISAKIGVHKADITEPPWDFKRSFRCFTAPLRTVTPLYLKNLAVEEWGPRCIEKTKAVALDLYGISWLIAITKPKAASALEEDALTGETFVFRALPADSKSFLLDAY
jgi:hypothetical protein